MNQELPTTAAVQEVLAQYPDPELGRSIVALKQVSKVSVAAGGLDVTVGLTTFAAPLWSDAQGEITQLLQARFPSVAVRVEIEEFRRPPEKLGEIGLPVKSVLAVGSGKGGVGKSTIACSLAYGLKRAGAKVGLMDSDVYGPSVPHLIGVDRKPEVVDNRFQPVVVDGMPVMSMGFMVPRGEAVIWRGPMLHNLVTQFLGSTDWGELDYLVIDMPPGTGDVALTLSQLLPISGAVVVCTPQDVALLDASRAIAMFRRVNIDVLGMVENMSSFVCPQCGAKHEIFSSGGARKCAEELKVPFLGDVPINIQTRIAGDEGRIQSVYDDPAVAPSLEAICRRLVQNLVAQRRQTPPMPNLAVLR